MNCFTRIKWIACIGIIASLFITHQVSADIILSMDVAGSTHFDTGAAGAGKQLSVYISQDAGATDTAFVWVADFTLGAGVISDGTVSDTGAIGTPGYFGAGNLSTSQFNFTAGDTTFNINQESTNSMQPVANEPTREKWFDFEIDTTGLPDGTYALSILDPAGSFVDLGFNPIAANNNLTFSVTSVPEPGSGLLLATLLGIGTLRRRRRDV